MKKGFTLLELLIVVIVIAILATFAIPGYLNAVEKAKTSKAKHHLGLIAQAEKMYRGEMDTYLAAADVDENADLHDYVEMDEVGSDADWDYAVAIVGADGFTATATRVTSDGGAAVTGNNAGTVTLDEDGTWGGTHRYAGYK